MKTIFRILVILAIAALLAGGMYLAVQNLPGGTEPGPRGGEQPQFAQQSPDGQTLQPRTRPAGDFGRDGFDREGEHGPALRRGLMEIVGMLIKLSVIVLLVLLAQKMLQEPLKKLRAHAS